MVSFFLTHGVLEIKLLLGLITDEYTQMLCYLIQAPTSVHIAAKRHCAIHTAAGTAINNAQNGTHLRLMSHTKPPCSASSSLSTVCIHQEELTDRISIILCPVLCICPNTASGGCNPTMATTAKSIVILHRRPCHERFARQDYY